MTPDASRGAAGTAILPDGAARFAARFPVVWHVIEAEGADAAGRHGLLPAAELRRLAGHAADSGNRPDFARLVLPDGGAAVLRPQLMADARLAPTLRGVFAGQPAVWRAFIDSRVFFWATPARRDAFLRAVIRARARSPGLPGRERPHVLAIDTAALLRAHAAEASITRINSGSTVRGGARVVRDEATFQPVAAFRGGPVAELAIRGQVPLAGIVLGGGEAAEAGHPDDGVAGSFNPAFP